MSNFIIILGKSGTGKSRSIKSLNPKETVVINVLGKVLPFKGSNTTYSKGNKNLCQLTNFSDVLTLLDYVNDKSLEVKNIVIDDAIYIMRTEFFERAKETGYGKYNELGDHFRKIIVKCNTLRKDLNIFMMLHSEAEETDGNIIGYKASTVGKLLDKLYNPLENVTMVLYSEPKYDSKGNPQYGFYTHRVKIGSIELPAKTPEDMFKEDFIPNDLGLVVKAISEYYG